ncbi:WXG100 family type VII secretion target [Rothia nasimurium]|uniref:WXG100 family type VII secretion target n=1 Tax=Rothia nasimurium TaxID=85336 RepID=UPI001F3F15EC|nr:WXG100 family type VII secretion target [Rothia nasimurium]
MPIKLDYAAMEAEAANLQSAAADFEASLSNLLNRINNLTSPEGGFSTEVSSGAFGTSYQEFNSKATQLIPSLQAFQQDLKNTIERFKAADGA